MVVRLVRGVLPPVPKPQWNCGKVQDKFLDYPIWLLGLRSWPYTCTRGPYHVQRLGRLDYMLCYVPCALLYN